MRVGAGHAVITLSPPHDALDASVLDRRDGFAWWYFDLVNDDASCAVVVIASFALPFLPQRGDTARGQPSINVAVYEHGRPRWYALQELDAQDASFSREGDDDVLRFGRSTIRVARRDGRLRVDAQLDVEMEGVGRARGTLHSECAMRVDDDVQAPMRPADVDHEWSWQSAPGQGRAELLLDDKPFVLQGRAYHDRNAGRCSLRALGIARWVWGRASFFRDDRVAYALWPQGGGAPRVFGVVVGPDGHSHVVDGLTCTITQAHTTLFGIDAIDAIEFRTADGALFLAGTTTALVDNGPFYQRSLWRARHEDPRDAGAIDDGTGVFEVVVPPRIDLPAHRPLVAMRVARGPRSSWWLPLFAGTMTSWPRRFARLARAWLTRAQRSFA